MRIFTTCIAGALLLELSAYGEPSLGEVPAGVVADWPAYGATPGGTHFSRARQITHGFLRWLRPN